MSEKANGILLAKPTGNVLAEDPQYIEVLLPDNQLVYARPCYLFGFCAAPSVEWLNKYKNEIFICIINQDGYRHKPMWVGYTPMDGKLTDAPANFPRAGYFRTENFIQRFDDENKKLSLEERDTSNTVRQFISQEDGNLNIETEKLYVESKDSITEKAEKIILVSPQIKIGSDSAQEHLVLGDELNKNLNTLYDNINKLITAVTTFNSAISVAQPIASAASPALIQYKADIDPITTSLKSLIMGLQQQISAKHTTE